MGYYTELAGELTIEPSITSEHRQEISKLLRDSHGGDHLHSECPWTLGCHQDVLEAAGYERPYDYVEWLQIAIKEVFAPRGYTLNGKIYWYGSDPGDQGTIFVQGNVVEAVCDIIYNPGPSWDRKFEAGDRT